MVLLLLVLAPWAYAHRDEFPKQDTLELFPDEARLHLSYQVPPDEAQALRRLFARAADAALADHLARLAALFVRLTVDGRPVALHRGPVELSAASDGSLGVRTTLFGEVRLSAGPHLVSLSDRHKDRRIAVPLRLRLHNLRTPTALPPLPLLAPDHPLVLQITPPS